MKQAGRSWTGIRYLHRHHGVLALKIRRGAETGVKAGFRLCPFPVTNKRARASRAREKQEIMPEARKLEPAGIAFGRPARLVPG